MRAEILTIGTELLLGEIVDTNARELARALRDLGFDLFRTTSVGDNPARIAQAVRESLERAEVVITTGGLGPTVDDPTREAVAAALGVETVFHPELWAQIEARYARFQRTPTGNNRLQARLPAGAQAIENPVGTAPAFVVEVGERCVLCLPGVPEEMRVLLTGAVIPYLRSRSGGGGVILTRLLRTAGLPESTLDERIQDLERGANPTVGLSAHPGLVDVRLTAKASDEAAARALLAPLEQQLRARMGAAVYGVDDETLEAAALRAAAARGWRVASVERGTHGRLARRLATAGAGFAGGHVLADDPQGPALADALSQACQQLGAPAGLGAELRLSQRGLELTLCLRTPEGEHTAERAYGGTLANAADLAVALALDLLRRRLA